MEDEGAGALPGLLDLGLTSGRVLVLADGDCGYAAALARARPGLHVCASTYDVPGRVPAEHAAAVAELICEVDFTEPLPGGPWDRIVVNFPAPVGRRHVSRARSMVRLLLLRCSAVLADGGQVWLTLEDGAGVVGDGAQPLKQNGAGWDVVDAAADADLVLVGVAPARARAVYAPRGARTDGTAHVLSRPPTGAEGCGAVTLVRDVNVVPRGASGGVAADVAELCRPFAASVEALGTHPPVEAARGAAVSVRITLSSAGWPLSRRKAHALCQALETGGEVQLEPLKLPATCRKPGWNVWFHKVEPSVEDLLSLLARPVERAEDATLLWTNAPWAHAHAWVNHFADAALNKRDVALALRGTKHIPRTFVLPDETEAWAEAHAPYWIAKPAKLGRGVGVVVFPDAERPAVTGVVSEYVARPLLIAQRKVDLRLYVLVRTLDPVRAFVHQNGYVRFAALEYGLGDFVPQRHLTNNAVNRTACQAPPPLDGFEVNAGDNWPLSGLWQRVDRPTVWPRIRQLLGESLAAIAPKLAARDGTRPFGLLGFDVLLDDQLKPWLCEINANPTLEGKRCIDRGVDLEVIGDLLDILGDFEAPRWEEL